MPGHLKGLGSLPAEALRFETAFPIILVHDTRSISVGISFTRLVNCLAAVDGIGPP